MNKRKGEGLKIHEGSLPQKKVICLRGMEEIKYVQKVIGTE